MKERDFRDFINIIYRRKKTILIVVLSSLLTAIVLSKKLPPVYETRVTLLPPSRPREYSLASTLEATGISFLTPMISKEILKGYLGILASVSVAKYVDAKIPERNLWQIRGSSKFDVNNYNLIEIIVRDGNPQLAAKIANTYAEAFNAFFKDVASQEIEEVRAFTEKQFELAKRELVSAEERLRSFKESQGIASIDEETSKLVSEAADLEAQRRKLMIELAENEIKLNSTKRLLAEQTQMQKYSEVTAQNPIFQQLKSELVNLEVQLAGAKQDYGESHIKVIALKTQIGEVRKQLREEVEKVAISETSRVDPTYQTLAGQFVSLQVTKDSLQAQKEALDIAIKRVKARLLKLPQRNLEYVRLLRDVTLQENIYNMLALKLEEAKIQKEYERQGFVVLNAASAPKNPVFPVLIYNVMAAVGFSVVGSIFLCFLLEYIDELRITK